MKPEWHDARMSGLIDNLHRTGAAARITLGRIFLNTVHYLCYLIAAALASTGAAQAQIPGATQNVAASIEAETITPGPGDTVTLAIVMKPKPGWHDYWLNPADAGTPLELEWQLPPGVTAGPIRAPVPTTLIVGGFMNHIYKETHAFLVELTIAPSVRGGQPLPVKVAARWSACSDTVCVPEGGNLAVNLVAGKGNIDAASRSRFDAWRSALPVPLDRHGRYAITGKLIDIAIPFPASAEVANVWFFPATQNVFRYAAPQSARRTGNWLVVTSEVSDAFNGRIDGLLRFNDVQGLEVRAMPGSVPAGGNVVTVLGQGETSSRRDLSVTFGVVLGFSILGGLLLNLMPCVFPILGLKALALAKAGGDERAARSDALAYTSGVILSCIALGGVLLALRAGGEQVGWAFQLQEPAIVLLLLLLMVAVTANLAGLFDIGSIGAGDGLTRQGGIWGSFWTGVLAAVVATPCTGPFMAAAMGAALLLPVAEALLLFAGLGFGLALPFLAIAYIPALRRMLPKPGPWLNTFRKVMAIPMALTALALLWLLWRLMGTAGLVVGGIAAAALLFGLWVMVREMGVQEVARKRTYLSLALVIFGMGGIAIGRLPEPTRGENVEAEADRLASLPFSESLLSELRGKGLSTFVYFTADWCVTCKINEAAAINREETAKAFAAAGIVTLKGDFTRRDADIARFLARHGRSGVPLYLYYPAGGEPQVLPQILTVDTLTALAK